MQGVGSALFGDAGIGGAALLSRQVDGAVEAGGFRFRSHVRLPDHEVKDSGTCKQSKDRTFHQVKQSQAQFRLLSTARRHYDVYAVPKPQGTALHTHDASPKSGQKVPDPLSAEP